jgi:hypothetical protein
MRSVYPFGRAAGSFELGGPGPPPEVEPLLAYGANASPERLAAKLPGVRVVALAAELRGWAVVHSAHVSPYGSVPATIVEVPSRPPPVARVHVLLVADAGPLDATEPNYHRVRLTGLHLEADRLGRLDAVDAYVSKWGPLLVGGEPVPLGSRPQAELLALVRKGA